MAIDFDFSSGYVDCGSSASLDDIQNLSVTTWAYIDQYDAAINGIAGKSSTGVNNGWMFFLSSTTVDLMEFIVAFTTTTLRTSTPGPTTGVWHHLAVTYAGNSTAAKPSFYVDGSSVAGSSLTNTAGSRFSDATYSLTVGKAGLGGYLFDGRLEDTRVFNRILSAQEIAELAAGYRGPLGSEVLWLPMGDRDGDVLSSASANVFDMSANGNHGTPQGGTCVGQASYAPRMGGWIP